MLTAFVVLTAALASDFVPRAPGAAETGALFVGPSIDFSLSVPANGATIPKNARLLVFGQFFDDESQPDTETTVSFHRSLANGERVPLDALQESGTSLNGRAYMIDLGELVVGDTIFVGCDLCFDEWSGTVVDAIDDEPPAFRTGNKNRISVTDMGQDVGYQVRACIPAPIDAAGGNVALRVITDVRDGYGPAFQGNGNGLGGCSIDEVDVAAFADGGPRAFCFQTLAVDAAGNESLFHEDICTELPEHAPQGCTQTTGAPLAAALALLALIRCTRRMGRTSPRRGR
jgi:hypothetical protein